MHFSPNQKYGRRKCKSTAGEMLSICLSAGKRPYAGRGKTAIPDNCHIEPQLNPRFSEVGHIPLELLKVPAGQSRGTEEPIAARTSLIMPDDSPVPCLPAACELTLLCGYQLFFTDCPDWCNSVPAGQYLCSGQISPVVPSLGAALVALSLQKNPRRQGPSPDAVASASWAQYIPGGQGWHCELPAVSL